MKRTGFADIPDIMVVLFHQFVSILSKILKNNFVET